MPGEGGRAQIRVDEYVKPESAAVCEQQCE